jgi:hypothetical protein
MFIPDPKSDDFPSRIPNKGSKRFPDPGSGTASKKVFKIQKYFSKLSEI